MLTEHGAFSTDVWESWINSSKFMVAEVLLKCRAAGGLRVLCMTLLATVCPPVFMPASHALAYM